MFTVMIYTDSTGFYLVDEKNFSSETCAVNCAMSWDNCGYYAVVYYGNDRIY